MLLLLAACRPAPVLSPPTSPLEAKRAAVEALDLPGFTVLVEGPWVVAGDEPGDAVRQRAVGTIRWATAALRHQFDFQDPDEVWTIWMFRDETSYQHHAWTLFQDRPDTPYGYATDAHHALVMNIGTGGGTMIHEMVHPMLHASFPAVPPWFNEGLASLYEQCSDDGAEGIRGELNWRLPGTQQAISEDWMPPLTWLIGLQGSAFYEADQGSNYGQARYLLYYLQEQGKLTAFYDRLRSHSTTDPTGQRALEETLGITDLAAWEASVWRPYVLALVRE